VRFVRELECSIITFNLPSIATFEELSVLIAKREDISADSVKFVLLDNGSCTILGDYKTGVLGITAPVQIFAYSMDAVAQVPAFLFFVDAGNSDELLLEYPIMVSFAGESELSDTIGMICG
jgi:hypothetical protein